MKVGFVIIGRNEGERLKTCLESVKYSDGVIIYVDSGSTDESVTLARGYGAHVVELDMSQPFSAARARNEGFNRLLESHPTIDFVQFVDGDCEILITWIPKAISFLEASDEYAVVCGRRKERFPESSIYNQICDIEWDTPVGDALACGGDALMRVSALKSVNGYDASFIAGEEPELCFRLRQNSWKIARIDEEMTRHDANMTTIGQWWKRSLRSGYAYQLNYFKHGHKPPEFFKKKEIRSIKFWCLVMLALSIITILAQSVLVAILSVSLMGIQILRTTMKNKYVLTEYGFKIAFVYASSNLFAKIPQLIGVLRCNRKHKNGLKHTLVEYK